MLEANGVNTPMFSTWKLSKHWDDTIPHPFLYRSTVGALKYITLTRSDITFSVNKAFQYLASPLDSHQSVVKWIIHYLSGTRHHGHILNPTANPPTFSLRAYNDSNWASDPDDRRSTSGSCIFLGRNLVAWSSKKQSLFSRSSAETKFRALSHATFEVLWIESLLRELKIPHLSPTLLCDNMSTVKLSHNSILHARTKHIELDIHFVRECVMVGKLHI